MAEDAREGPGPSSEESSAVERYLERLTAVEPTDRWVEMPAAIVLAPGSDPIGCLTQGRGSLVPGGQREAQRNGQETSPLDPSRSFSGSRRRRILFVSSRVFRSREWVWHMCS